MNKNPVYIVDDDVDDQQFLIESWKELGYENPLVFFRSAGEVVNRLREKSSHPFLILCDVNLPKVDGFQLKSDLLNDAGLNCKSIPFIFWSGVASESQIQKAFDLGAHGFFLKGSTLAELKESLQQIMSYWQNSKQPAF